jgi:polysaccharide biosynthesis protein PslG
MLVRLLIAALLTLAVAAPSAAAAVPNRFYGASYDGELRNAPADVQAQAWRRMAANGVESARSVFSWQRAQGGDGDPFDFTVTDGLVRHAAESGVQLLPIVGDTPVWARARVKHWWPERTRDFAHYMDALVTRYGPDGHFWKDNPGVPERPLRYWQIYNEPGMTKHYAPLLKTAHNRVAAGDPGGKIVFAGLTGFPGGAPWDVLRYLYRKGGIKNRWFDIAALHLYTGKAKNVDDGVRLFRRVLKRHGGRRKPVWMTEFGITASKGRTTAPRAQRTLRTTDEGMADFLAHAYRSLARKHRRLRLGRAYWYTWATSYEPGSDIFEFAGLNRYADGELEARPALARYRAVAGSG